MGERPFQTLDNLERMMAVTAHVVVRLLKLKLLGEAGEEATCETVLLPEEWVCLHVVAKPGTKPPKRPPSSRWALRAIARLGGWYDTKRTGRIGWQTLWNGYHESARTWSRYCGPEIGDRCTNPLLAEAGRSVV